MQTIITSQDFQKTVDLLNQKYEILDETGCFFAIISTEYDYKGNVIHDCFQVISEAVEIGYHYINTIVYPTTNVQYVSFKDSVRYVVWLCKNPDKMIFNKDAIREKHIWKDVEWGKRTKNYNPKGKDPGNVWIPTLDDGRANITDHILLSDDDVIKRIIAMSNCGESYEISKEDSSCCQVSFANNFFISDTRKNINTSGTVVFDSSEKMDKIDDSSVSVIVTSPPYWNLKDYFKKGQIGQEPYEDYLKRIKSVWNECYLKLNDNGSLWININIRVHNKKVILIPKDFIEICKNIGFYYKGIFIWHKSSGIPTGEKNIVDRHEYILVFSKNENFFIDCNKQESFSDYKNDAINGGAFWNINRKAGSVGKKYIHPAIYPNDLVKRIVLLTTNKGDLVLDPFLGSGTSLIAALQCTRNFIGYEYNEGFKELMEARYSIELYGKHIEYI